MERKERRHHTREFKLEAVRLAGVGDKAKAKVARELGVGVNQLRQWRLDLEEEERNGVPRQGLATAEQDVGKLRRENARLREEVDILKKRPSTSRRCRIEVRIYRYASLRTWCAHAVQGTAGIAQWVLCGQEPAAQRPNTASVRVGHPDSGSARGQP